MKKWRSCEISMFSVTTWKRHRKRPDIIAIDKKDQIVVLANVRVGEKERQKVEKYLDFC